MTDRGGISTPERRQYYVSLDNFNQKEINEKQAKIFNIDDNE